MKILHVAPSFYPATWWGGPIHSTKAICDGIATIPGVDLRVLTTDAASPDRHDRIAPALLGYPVHYARRIAGHSVSPGLLARLPEAVHWADVVHLTGTYSFPTLPTLALARAMGRPVVWSPRGALQATQDWADAPHRHRKQAFEHAANLLRGAGTVLHVTAPSEAKHSVTRLQGVVTAVIPNAVALPEMPLSRRARGGGLRLIYLGRLHPKKGVDLLIDAMAGLAADTQLDIYGDGEADHVAMLARRAAAFAGRVRLRGHVAGAAKTQAFADADLFVLPTHSENFGIAVAEALAHGVPVITTTAAPWAALIRQGCGRSIDLARDDLAVTIRDIARCDLRAMGEKGRDWMARDFSQAAMVARFARLYHELVPGRGLAVPA